MPESSPPSLQKSPRDVLPLRPSPLLCAFFLGLGAAAGACCIFLLPAGGIGGALRWLCAVAAAAYGAQLAAEHGLRLGPRALAAVALLPEDRLRMVLGGGEVTDVTADSAEVHGVAPALLSFSWHGAGGRRRCAVIPADAMEREHHRLLRAALVRWGGGINR